MLHRHLWRLQYILEQAEILAVDYAFAVGVSSFRVWYVGLLHLHTPKRGCATPAQGFDLVLALFESRTGSAKQQCCDSQISVLQTIKPLGVCRM